MKKGLFKGVYVLSCLLAFSLCGCVDSGILAEKLQTAALERELARIPESTEAKVPGFLYEQASEYAYGCLSEAEALWYCNIADCLGFMREEIRLDKQGIEQGLDETDIDRIFQCVLMDHPELFYVEGYTYRKYTKGDRIVAIQFSGTYSMDAEQAIARHSQIELEVENILDGAKGFTDDYDKVKYVYETVIYHTEYNLDASDNQNMYSVFVNRESVCQGYAKAVQYLLERMGVECTLVFGTVENGEGHAWNLVKVNGNYYYVDATWGDPSYQLEQKEPSDEYFPEISYDYLCITTEQLLRTHLVDEPVPMPYCTEEKDNYYVREGALFTHYDREQMQRVFQQLWEKERVDINLRCVNEEVFQQILYTMVEEQEVFTYLPEGSDSISYTQNERQLSMTFWVTNQ